MKKPALVIGLLLAIAALSLIFFKNRRNVPPVTTETETELPVNTIPVEERPFITLAPDATGRSLAFSVTGAPQEGELEYELVYNAADKQEGVFGRIDLAQDKQPVTKDLLLGSKSAGGKVTYHEGVTGGALTVTYGDIRLKEQFNFLHFDPADPTVTSSDVRFAATLPKTALKPDGVVVVMKTFGLPADLPGKLVAGPYAYLTAAPVKGNVQVELKLPAGDHANAAIYVHDGQKWTELKTSLQGEDTLTAVATSGQVFAIATP